MATTEELEAKLKRLERELQVLKDIEAIKQLKGKYFRCLDSKLWDEMAECFTEDATTSYSGGKLSFKGRDAIIKFFKLGRDLNQRDVIAVKHTVSGLLKLPVIGIQLIRPPPANPHILLPRASPVKKYAFCCIFRLQCFWPLV